MQTGSPSKGQKIYIEDPNQSSPSHEASIHLPQASKQQQDHTLSAQLAQLSMTFNELHKSMDQNQHEDKNEQLASQGLDVVAYTPIKGMQEQLGNASTKQKGEEGEQIQCGYLQLSSKLQNALRKIKSSQKQKSKTESFYDRVQYFQKKKRSHVQTLKLQKQVQAEEQLKKKSLTNIHSQKLISNYQPIHERYQKIVEQKKKKIQMHKTQQVERQQKEIDRQIEMMNKKVDNPRTNEEFVNSMLSWQEKKERKVAEQMAKQQLHVMNGVTFAPQINQKSKQMAKKTGAVPIYQRDIKPKRIQIDQQCTFKPNITKSKH